MMGCRISILSGIVAEGKVDYMDEHAVCTVTHPSAHRVTEPSAGVMQCCS